MYCQTIFVVYCATGNFLVIGALQVPHYYYYYNFSQFLFRTRYY